MSIRRIFFYILLLQKDKKIISFWENINHFKKIQFLYTGWNRFVSESIRGIHFRKINLSNEKKMFIHCKDSFRRRIRQLYPSAKILIIQKNCFLYPSGDMWIRRNFFCEISLLKWNTNVITLREKNLWKYESIECFSLLYTGWNHSVDVLIRKIFFCKIVKTQP